MKFNSGFVPCGLVFLLTACGGGGGGGSTSTTPSPTPTPGTAIAQKCSPNNPYRFDDTAFSTTGTLNDEKAWLKANMQEKYLWYSEIPNVNPALAQFSQESNPYLSLDTYFEALKSPYLTAAGVKKDQFSFTALTRDWLSFLESGAVLNYGIEWHYSRSSAPWQMTVAYVSPGSQAALVGVLRGDQLKTIDGLPADGTASNQAAVNAALYPKAASAHTMVFQRGASVLSLNVVADSTKTMPVLPAQIINTASGPVGYLVFNSHISSAEKPLIDAINLFKNNNVQSLILDLRYNSGGYLYIASELAYMIAGPNQIQNRVFDRLQFSDQRPAQTAVNAIPFYATAQSSQSGMAGQLLPNLNLKQVFILATENTCSASEAIINGLRGIDVDVQIIGKTTCGKPYGFIGQSNCGISYFPIEFTGSNAKGFGDFTAGFAPQCTANDDFSRPLGDINEGLLAAALFRRSNPNSCKPPIALNRSVAAGAALGAAGAATTDPTAYIAQPEMNKNQYLGWPK
ncbi:S41 family peptidase [uncultured Deefgea sp.]|uniref:S41 family peptidase n=1 Tax=uncultured Deefgea sp. TaxID=1304914 RepID=UPI00260E760C|nr:S41 family peptidase [uncultured Deefgea sp.]